MPYAVRWIEPGSDPTPTKDVPSAVMSWGIVDDEDDDGYTLEALLSGDFEDDEDAVLDIISECWCPVPDSVEVRYVMRAYQIPRISEDGGDTYEEHKEFED